MAGTLTTELLTTQEISMVPKLNCSLDEVVEIEFMFRCCGFFLPTNPTGEVPRVQNSSFLFSFPIVDASMARFLLFSWVHALSTLYMATEDFNFGPNSYSHR